MIDAFGVERSDISKAAATEMARIAANAPKGIRAVVAPKPQVNATVSRVAAKEAGRRGDIAAGRAARAQSRGTYGAPAQAPAAAPGYGNMRNLNPQLAARARKAGIPETPYNAPGSSMNPTKSSWSRNKKIAVGAGAGAVGAGGILATSNRSNSITKGLGGSARKVITAVPRFLEKESKAFDEGMKAAGFKVTYYKAPRLRRSKNVSKRYFSEQSREKLADKGKAMSDGSFPIVNANDLKNAKRAVGRAKNPEAAKAWIARREAEMKRSK